MLGRTAETAPQQCRHQWGWLDFLASIIGSLAWPGVVLVILWYNRISMGRAGAAVQRGGGGLAAVAMAHCSTCGQFHRGLPSCLLGLPAPLIPSANSSRTPPS